MSGWGLIGNPLSHSWSPMLHRCFGNPSYGLYPLKPEELEPFLTETELSGINVTIPYKKAVIPYCSALSPTARKLGSVNTMIRCADGWHGYNTDYFGFCALLSRAGIHPKGKSALVLGSGGAGVTAKQALLDLEAASVTVVSRSGAVTYKDLHQYQDADLIVNATPVGMYPENGTAPISLADFPNCSGVVDLVYNPLRTALILAAERRGIPCTGGLYMLAAQAGHAAELFYERAVSQEQIRQAAQALEREMRSLILIGMPGCGKSTIAEKLGQMTGRPVVDSDAEICRRAEKTIPEIFRDEGEAGFRAKETAVLREVCKIPGIILATGGGAVTTPENYEILRQNGMILWLKRDPSLLPCDGRPISAKTDPVLLYGEREPLYRRFSDASLRCSQTPEETAAKIREMFL